MVDVPKGHLFLGGEVDPATHERTGDSVMYEASNFTTHGVIVGMTGSGKTGLAMIMLEEALLAGIPTLILDPKGDMGNLLLNFPDLDGPSFEPWVNEADAKRDGIGVDEHAANTAEMWKNGLAGWGIEPERLRQLKDGANFTIYTPGSTSGVPLNVIGDLQAPVGEGVTDESRADEIEGFVSSLLGLVSIDADPLSSPEHILLSNIINHHWSAGTSVDIADLVGQVIDPPIRKLGVLEVDDFFPKKDRTALAMRLNGLLASPSFASWNLGESLDIQSMLFDGDKPNAAIISLAHLSDEERQFVVTLVLSKAITWMRAQGGTPELRALIYMDEVFGFVPPTANPPSKKPILTILKQARAFGLGMVLSTQNPVDVDYKAISNAGTWMIGRLQTERDKARLLEGLSSASGEVDVAAVDRTISGLDKREFVLQSTKTGLSTFTTRWAMSYLPGPLTGTQISALMADRSPIAAAQPSPGAAATATPAASPPAPSAAPAPAVAASALADDETSMMPAIADGIPTYFLDPRAPWAEELEGFDASSNRYSAAVFARVHLLFDETKGDLRHEEEYEAVFFPLADRLDPDRAISVDYDDRDLLGDGPAGAVFVLPDAKVKNKTYFSAAQKALKDHLYRTETVSLRHNPELKLVSRIDESEEDFRKRCNAASDDGADKDAAKLRATLEKKKDRVDAAINKAEDKVRQIESDTEARKSDEKMSIIGDVATSVLGGLFGGKKSARGLLGSARRASSKRRTTSNARERLETAENRLGEKVDELGALEEELADSLLDINEVWDDKAAAIESLEVGLEKNDISIDHIAVVWIPVS